MKYLVLFLAVVWGFVCTVQAADVLGQVYGARVSECIQDTNVDTFTTTLDAQAAAAQKVVPLTATADLEATDWIVIDPTGAANGPEACYIASVSAGVSVTCTDDLVATHASGQTANLTNRLPKTGSGFKVRHRYRMTCLNTGFTAGVPCEVIFGAATVDAGSVVGEIFPGSALIAPDRIFAINSNGRFLSVVAADDTTVTICPMD